MNEPNEPNEPNEAEAQAGQSSPTADDKLADEFRRLKESLEEKMQSLSIEVRHKLDYGIHHFDMLRNVHEVMDRCRNYMAHLPDSPGAPSAELTLGQLMAQDWDGNLAKIGVPALTPKRQDDASTQISTAWQRDDNPARHLQLKLMDNQYWLASPDGMQKIAASTRTSELHYIKERFDCDDFASLFRSACATFYGCNAVGFVWDYTGRHSYNIAACLADDGSIVFRVIEPQDDTFVAHDMQRKAPYSLENGLVLM